MIVLVKKQKNTELNFLYLDDENKENKKSKKSKIKPKKNNNRAGKSKSAQEDTDKFNFDNEIVIGVTKIPKENVNNRKNVKGKKVQKHNKKGNIKTNTKNNKVNEKKQKIQSKNNTNKRNKKSKKNIIIRDIVKWAILLSALVASFIFFMMSPLFNISEINVVNNEKISSDTIVSLSGIKIGENIYKTSSKTITKNIKQNAYIESVEIQRKLPNKIEISVKERKTTYMLEYANSYAYINNQGYILEISQEKLNVPIITGYTTPQEDIKAGNRLNSDDLERLEMVLKIMDVANGNEIGNLISKINIQDKQNYTIISEQEKKTIYLGDASDLSNKMLHVKAILIEEKGVEGEIFVNQDLNKYNAFFRQKI